MRSPVVAAVTVLAMMPALSVSVGTPARAKDGVGLAIAGGLIAGAAIGAAIADSKKHPKKVYVTAPPPVAPPFNPKPNVTCYPQQQACYKQDGSYNSNWTWKIYAR